MWDEMTTLLTTFPTAVLTALDDRDHPASVRVTPTADPTTRVLRGPLPPGLGLLPGPACLLCHHHDDHLWGLRSMLIRGHLDTTPDQWVLTPQQLTRGQGLSGPLGDARTFLTARRRASRYLRHRRLTAPAIPWDQIRHSTPTTNQVRPAIPPDGSDHGLSPGPDPVHALKHPQGARGCGWRPHPR